VDLDAHILFFKAGAETTQGTTHSHNKQGMLELWINSK